MDLVKTPGLLAIIIGHKVLTWYFEQKYQKSISKNLLSGINEFSMLKKN